MKSMIDYQNKRVLYDRIYQLMKDNSLNQCEFADKTEVDRVTINRIMNLHIVPSMKILLRIARVFHVSVDWLTGTGEDEKNGTWLIQPVGYKCSNCSKVFANTFNFCPICGSRNRKENKQC